jgi:hypothetical protein
MPPPKRSGQGKPHGGRGPYGYRFVTKAEGDNALVGVPDEGRIVVFIFEWADEGRSMRKIARRLIADGVPPPHSHWNAWTVAKILRPGRARCRCKFWTR